MFRLNLKQIKEAFIVGFYFSMLCGFLIFSAYFIKIGYFPTSDLQSILYLPVIMTLTGILYFGCFIGLFGFAPFMWVELLKNKHTCVIIAGKDNVSKVIAAYEEGIIDLEDKSRKRIFFAYCITMSVSVGSWLLITALNQPYCHYLLSTFFLLGIIGKKWVFWNKKDNNENIDYPSPNKRALFLSLIKIYSFSILPGFALFISALFLGEILSINNYFRAFSFFVFIIVYSSFCLIPISKEWKLSKWMLLIASVSIITLFLLLGGVGDFSTRIVHLFKFGDIKNTSINVNQVGCEILRSDEFNVLCDENKKIYRVNNIDILWRLGEYFIQDSQNPTRQVILPLKYVYPSIVLADGKK